MPKDTIYIKIEYEYEKDKELTKKKLFNAIEHYVSRMEGIFTTGFLGLGKSYFFSVKNVSEINNRRKKT